MVVRICIALSTASEQAFFAKLLPTTRDELIVVARLDSRMPLIPQLLPILHHCDLVVYDPSIDNGMGLALWAEHGATVPLCCWCSDPRDIDRCGAAVPLLTLRQCASGIDVDVAIRRCKRRLRDHITVPSMIARSPEAEYRARIVSFPQTSGIEVYACESIVHIEGQGNYSNVIFLEKPRLVLSRTIGDFVEELSGEGFLRVHRSHIVNLRHIRRLMPGKVPRLLMANGDRVSVSERYRALLLRNLNVIKRK